MKKKPTRVIALLAAMGIAASLAMPALAAGAPAAQGEPAAEAAPLAEKAAPQLPGFDLVTDGTIDPDANYLVVAQDKCQEKNDVYALYLSEKGLSTKPGSLNKANNGAVAAKLEITADAVSAAYVNDQSALTLEDLLLTVAPQDDGYTVYNQKNARYLAMSESAIVTADPVVLQVEQSDSTWLFCNPARPRYLDFNTTCCGRYPNNSLDFWGPDTRAAGSFAIYLYRQQDAGIPDGIPGFHVYAEDTIDTSLQYLLVAKDKTTGQPYALYLSEGGAAVKPGSLGTQGSVTAQLDNTGSTLTGAYLKDGSALTEEQMLLTFAEKDGAYSLRTASTGYYLDLNTAMSSTTQRFLQVSRATETDWKIATGSRMLDFNIHGDGGQFQNYVTDFWGPNNANAYDLTLYAKDVPLADTQLRIEGYTQVQDEHPANGRYVVIGAQDGAFFALDTVAAGNASQGTRSDSGYLENSQQVLQNAVLSLTAADGGVYLSAKTNGKSCYLGLKDGKVFRTDAPQLLALSKTGEKTYALSSGETTLSLADGAFGCGAEAAALQLYRMNESEPEVAVPEASAEKGYAVELKLTAQPQWLYTDENGLHEPDVVWTVLDGQDVVEVEGSFARVIAEKGAARLQAEVVYGDALRKTVGTMTVQAAAAPAPIRGTADRPFPNGVPDGEGDQFRIPALLTLQNGWLVAASDMRWKTTADSPQNLDTIVSVSKDGGKTWEYEIVNYFDDQANSNTSQASASFIDPALIQGSDGKLYMVADACPSYVGLMGGNRMGRESDGFDDEGRLLVTLGKEGQDASTRVQDYTYRVDLRSGRTVKAGEDTLTLYAITSEAGDPTGTWVDAELDLYTWDGESEMVSKVMCQQLNSSRMVHSNLFYRNAAWKAYPVFYIMLRTAEVKGDSLVWGQPQLLNIKMEEYENFTGVCPGRGITTTVETADGAAERIIFPVYDNATGRELASVVYSDDGGATWKRGSHSDQVQDVGKTSESQIIRLPDGALRMYSRNTIGYISYSDSTDGGVTWGRSIPDKALQYTSNCMVSFINAEGVLLDAAGNVYENIVLASYPQGGGRNDGVIRVGFANADNTVTWLNDTEIDFPGRFQYSCLTQKNGDTIGILFESGPTPGSAENGGAGSIYYRETTITDMLGEGWIYLEQAPETKPSMTVAVEKSELMAGETAELSAAVQGVDSCESVRWTITSDSDADVASLDKTESASGEAVRLTALAAGKATLRVTARAEINGQTIEFVQTRRVYVSDKNTVVLPDEFDANSVSPSQSRYQREKEEAANGVYLITNADQTKNMYYQSGKATTDQVTASVKGDEAAIEPAYPETRQTWKLNKTEGGYTIESCDEAGKYLNVTGATTSHLPLSTTPMVFAIEKAENGRFYVSTQVNGTTYYVSWNGKFAAVTEKVAGLAFFEKTEYVTLDASGLAALIDVAEQKDPQDYVSGWDAFQKALEDARQTVLLDGSTYADAAEAEKALLEVTESAKALYSAMRALKTEPEPTESPEPEPTESPKPTAEPTGSPVPTVRPDPDTTAAPSNPGVLPSTGDSVPAAACAVLLALSCAGAALVYSRKRAQKS